MLRLLLNGSPRGKDGNSRKLLSWIAQGLEQAGVSAPPIADLAPDPTGTAIVQAFLQADEVVIALPLYTDSMPAIVKAFFESVAEAEPARLRGKRVAFVVQSGFPEAIHTEVLADYFARLCERLGFHHLGTIRKGGIESIRMLPAKAVEKTAAQFRDAGKQLAEQGAFSPDLQAAMAGPRTFGRFARLVLRILVATGLGNYYWNTQLKKHKAFARRFDAPYAPAYRP